MGLSFQESKLNLIKKGWITIILFLIILSFFLVHLYWQQKEMSALQHLKTETSLEIERLKGKALYLQRALYSLDDPKWIERQMIEKLGVVPRGYKAYILDEEEAS